MLAEEFGYQVTSQPAAELTPAVRPATEQALNSEKQISSGCSKGCAIFAAVFFITFYIISLNSTSRAPIVIGIVGTILAMVLYCILARSQEASIAELEEKIPAVLASPWQVWPCRVEAIAGSQARRLLLLDPNGDVAREFHSVMPDEVWIGMTDGRALIWFAGDMRFGGLVSLPGGNPIWWVYIPKVTSQPAPSGPRQRLIEEELTRQAIAYVFDEWL